MARTARKQAPDIEVVDVFSDERADKLKALESKDNDFVYSYQDSNVTASRLSVLKQEVVKDESGETIKHGNDIVVKTPRKVFEGARALESERSFQMAKRIVSDPKGIKQVAAPKTPEKRETDNDELGE